jgi:hypothetical protein
MTIGGETGRLFLCLGMGCGRGTGFACAVRLGGLHDGIVGERFKRINQSDGVMPKKMGFD